MTRDFRISRRAFVGALAGSLPALHLARAQGPVPEAKVAVPDVERHGMSSFGDLKYPPDFAHFDYVNPDAPRGGTLSHVGSTNAYNQEFNTFNSLNMFILKGSGAHGMQLTFASLMTSALDEPDSLYGFVAQSVAISEDGLTYRFRIRQGAAFHDGTAISAEDAAFSILTLRDKGHPLMSQPLTWVEDASAESDVVTVRFKAGRSRDIPLMVAGLPILSKTYYSKQPFEESTLEAPLGSGPYKVGRFEAGRFIEYTRVADWWANDLPIAKGQYNFETIRYEYYRDRDVAFEGFKGRAYLFREDFTSRQWARGYDFPAVKDGRVVKDEIPDGSPSGAQGWFFNVRRDKFKDVRVREAITLAFDFEWVNQNIMFGSYQRTSSFFENSPLKAEGTPSAGELALLEPLRDKLSPAVFGEAAMPPTSDGSGRDRNNLRRAIQLLREAGWTSDGGKLINATGEAFTIELLDFDPGLEPHLSGFIANLKSLGIAAAIRRVDPTQFQARVQDFDFDIMSRRFVMSLTPGESLRLVFGSEAAKTKGSNNLSGIADPAVDALIESAIKAKTRDDLTVACKAIDRVIRAGHYWVPAWYKPSHWLAYWDVYERPGVKPAYARGVLETWWWNPDKAKKIGL
ncbi:ABC transporter substrate-binding protein [Agaricicola taiwanensis]|uniref:ABC transporter substrate-binding protein n=1 Tax=Agaricicola taiwanensis TaxID=591372 RepID=A0A8J2YG85_9RHOB|nr:extracellular solute-binding protein [Agaricicola taiwanensis]GGE33313.1 ABC transporter substrate-binding protein [Agaricicola taiwanensis]